LQPGKLFLKAVVVKILLAVAVASCLSGKLGALLINHENDTKWKPTSYLFLKKIPTRQQQQQAAKGNLLSAEENSQLKAANFSKSLC